MPVIAFTKPQKLQKAIKAANRDTKALCLDYGIKQKEIAEMLKIDPTAISHQFKSGITLDTYLAVRVLVDEKLNMNKGE